MNSILGLSLIETVKFLDYQYDLLGHDTLGWTEFRVLKMQNGGSEVLDKRLVNNKKEFIDTAQELLINQKTDENIFVGLNPRMAYGAKSSIGNIGYLCLLMIDMDPIRPKGTASTDEQHTLAINHALKIQKDILGSIVVDSGSGAHVYIPIKPILVENAKELTKSVKEWSDEIIEKYKTDRLKFDSVFDLPRVTRLWGSFNQKSKRTVTPINIDYNKTIERETKIFIQTETENNTPSTSDRTSSSRFRQLIKVQPGLQKILNGTADFKSPSERNFAFVSYLVKAHFSLEDIRALAQEQYPRQGSDKIKEAIDADVERIVDKIKKEGTSSTSFINSGEKYVQNLSQRRLGLSTSFTQLDELLSGLQPSKLYVLAARTNEGKTSLACHIAYGLTKNGNPVLYFPTELGYEPLFDKIIAQATEISLKKFQIGSFTDEEKKKIADKMQELSKLPFIVHQDFALTAQTVSKVSKEIVPSVIIIDFIQAMKYEDDYKSAQIENNIRSFKELNEQLNIPIILTSQLSRSAINSELNLSQLKSSGAIEEYADVVMALSTRSKTEYPRPVDLYILKSRYSEIGKIRLDFYATTGKFTEHSDK